jgi:hypothetical protein
MALQDADLFIVQKPAGTHAKLTAGELTTYVTNNSGSLTYRGTCDLTASTTGQLQPDPPIQGDLYINNTSGVSDTSWNGIPGSTTVGEGDRVIYDGSGWDHVPNNSNSGVVAIQAAQPIYLTGDADEPTINSRAATTATDGTGSGHVARLATVDDTKSDGTGETTAVVTADLLKATNVTVDTKLTTADLGAIDPIEIDTTTADEPKVKIKDATTGQKGATKLSDSTEASDTAEEDVALTPKGGHDNFLRLDFSSYTKVDPVLSTDIFAVYRPGTGNRNTTAQEIAENAPVQSVNGATGTVNLGIDDLSDVDTSTSAPGLSAALIWDGSNWVPGAAGSGGAVNLGYAAAADEGVITNDSGANATIPLATTDDAGLLAPGQFDKLEGLPATGTPTLDEVTDKGNITTNNITVNDITANDIDAKTVTSEGDIRAGEGDNLILLNSSNGEITGGANVFIDGGVYA